MTTLRLLLAAPLLAAIMLAPAVAGAATQHSHQFIAQSAQCKITQTHSLVGVKRTTLRFVNDTKGRVKVDWLSYAGKRVFYKALGPGAGYTQSTWYTHPWIVLSSSGRCIGYVIAGKPRTYIVR